MPIERKIAKLFKLTDENWMKHANPWSVWTRYSVLPIIVLAYLGKSWYLDRMVWIYEDMKHLPEYGKWEY